MSDWRFGYTPEAWERAKSEIRELLIQVARGATPTRTVTYHEVAQSVQAIELDPRDPKLNALLGDISKEEAQAGRGMLSALVVTADSGRPGEGFFEWAEELGLTAEDPEDLWQQQFSLVIASHTGTDPRNTSTSNT